MTLWDEAKINLWDILRCQYNLAVCLPVVKESGVAGPHQADLVSEIYHQKCEKIPKREVFNHSGVIIH